MKIREITLPIIPPVGDEGAITIYPFIIYLRKDGKVSDRLRDHEWVHILQVRKVGWFKFYLNYLKESRTKEYLKISTEQEAYSLHKNSKLYKEVKQAQKEN